MKHTYSLLTRSSTLLILLTSLFSVNVLAANLWASVNSNKVAKNEMFQLQLVTDQQADSSAINFDALKKDFYVSQPSYGTYQNSVNGKSSMRTTWTVSLAAKKLGNITIPSFSIDGVSSQPIEIHVSQNAQAPKASDLVEVQATLDKNTLYPQESAYLKTRLIIKTDPRSLQNPQIIPPSTNGLTLTPVGEQQQYQSILHGVNVTVVDQDYRITADKPGHYILKGPEFRSGILYVNRATGNTSMLDADTKAKVFDFTVEPKPASYHGYWLPTSSLKLSQQWVDQNGHDISTKSSYKTQVGDSITRTITMDVEGLTAEQLPNIVTHYPASIRVYADKPQFKTLPNNVTRMTLKQVLIPQQAGNINLEGVNIDWWNSKTKQQQTSEVAALSLNVTPAANQPAAPLPAYTAPTTTSSDKIVTVYDSGYWPYVSLVFGVLWLATLVLFFRAKRQSPDNQDSSTFDNSKPCSSLSDAINFGSAIEVQFLADQWLNQLEQRDDKLEKTIREEIQKLHRNEFKDELQPETNKELLLNAIAQLEKKQKITTKHNAKLAKL